MLKGSKNNIKKAVYIFSLSINENWRTNLQDLTGNISSKHGHFFKQRKQYRWLMLGKEELNDGKNHQSSLLTNNNLQNAFFHVSFSVRNDTMFSK